MKVRLNFNDMDKRIAECLIGTTLEGGWCLRGISENGHYILEYSNVLHQFDSIVIETDNVEFNVFMGVRNLIKMTQHGHNDIVAHFISSEWSLGQVLTALEYDPKPMIDWDFYFRDSVEVENV